MLLDINIQGGHKKKRELLEKAIMFGVNELVPRHSCLHLDIYLIRNLRDKEGVWGDCQCVDWDNYYSPKAFDIRLDHATCDENFLKTAFHELTHVKQYMKGELYNYIRKKGVRWNSKFYDRKWEVRVNSPWEKDAQKMENLLYKKFLKSEFL